VLVYICRFVRIFEIFLLNLLKVEVESCRRLNFYTVKPVYNRHPWDPKILTVVEAFQSKLLLYLIWPGLGWPLLACGRCSEVAVNTGLTVISYYLN
jgi:hypothetical protein